MPGKTVIRETTPQELPQVLALGDHYKWNRRVLRVASLVVSIPILIGCQMRCRCM